MYFWLHSQAGPLRKSPITKLYDRAAGVDADDDGGWFQKGGRKSGWVNDWWVGGNGMNAFFDRYSLCALRPWAPPSRVLGTIWAQGGIKTRLVLFFIFFAACKYFVFFGHFYALLPFFCLTFLLTLLLLLQQTMLGVGLPADQTGLVHARLHFLYASTRNPSVSNATQIH